MAVGLGFLGRGRTRSALGYWLLHVLGAAAAGAVVGGAFGGVGELLGLAAWRPWLIGSAAAAALLLGLRARPPKLGRQRQVPRRWSAGTAVPWVYTVWGAMLGCGLATPIFHSAFVLLTAAQVTGGVGMGIVSGALFGLARQAMALVPVVARYEPDRTMWLLERLRPLARRMNVALVVAGGVLLVAASWW